MSSKQHNILVIWGDDIGISNLSCYSNGVMGYRTPHIDRIANEGAIFTDYYGEQSCTAGRAAFIMGQSVFRSGLSKVGLPGAEADPAACARLEKAMRKASDIVFTHEHEDHVGGVAGSPPLSVGRR